MYMAVNNPSLFLSVNAVVCKSLIKPFLSSEIRMSWQYIFLFKRLSACFKYSDLLKE